MLSSSRVNLGVEVLRFSRAHSEPSLKVRVGFAPLHACLKCSYMQALQIGNPLQKIMPLITVITSYKVVFATQVCVLGVSLCMTSG